MSRDCPLDCKVYVGDLPTHVTDRDLEPAFRHYGPLVKVWVARNPPGFAFVEFEDPRDADDAIKDLDGTKICGAVVRVEQCSGKSRAKPWDRDRRPPPRGSRGGRSGGYNPDDRCYACGERGHYAYDCREQGGRGGGRKRSRSRSYDRSRRRRMSRSRSRGRSYSRSPRRRSSVSPRRRSRSPRRSESPVRRSDKGRNGNRSYSRSPRRSKSRSRSGSARRSPRDY